MVQVWMVSVYICLIFNVACYSCYFSFLGKIEPDSCFATLVSGREEIEKINEISPSLSNGANHFFTDKYIIIQKAAIVTV